MSKEEFLKIQTCVLKVNIHCDGCKQKVKKILQKIDGVYTTKIDAEQSKVTVSGNVDPATLIKKLAKSGKHAEIWGSKPNNNHNQINAQFKNMQIDAGKGPKQGQKGGGGGGGNGGGNGGNNQIMFKGGALPNPQQLQQLQQFQQMKGFQDLKLPQLKDMKMPFKAPPNQNQNTQKGVKFNLPEDDEDDDDMTDDEFDDDYDDDDEFDDDDEDDDDMDDDHHPPLNKMKPAMGKGPQGPNLMMNPQMMMNAKNGGNGAPAGKKGGGGNGGGGAIPVQINGGNGGKKGGGGNGINNGGSVKTGGKAGGGDGMSGNNKNGGGDSNMNHGAKKGGGNNGGVQPMNNLPQGFPNMNGGGPMGPMGQIGNMPRGGQMGQLPTMHGLPNGGMNNGGGGGGGAPAGMAGNPYQHQMAAMMNQQRAMGNERFQPMMYARPPPAVNYMPPYPPAGPSPYPYPQQPYPPQADPYTHYFSDENTSSCNIM